MKFHILYDKLSKNFNLDLHLMGLSSDFLTNRTNGCMPEETLTGFPSGKCPLVFTFYSLHQMTARVNRNIVLS